MFTVTFTEIKAELCEGTDVVKGGNCDILNNGYHITHRDNIALPASVGPSLSSLTFKIKSLDLDL